MSFPQWALSINDRSLSINDRWRDCDSRTIFEGQVSKTNGLTGDLHERADFDCSCRSTRHPLGRRQALPLAPEPDDSGAGDDRARPLSVDRFRAMGLGRAAAVV